MAVTKLATQVPAPQVVPAYSVQKDYAVTVSIPSIMSGKSLVQFATKFVSKFNQNAAALDILAQYGSGTVALIHGLGLTAGTGLSAVVGTGGGVCGGLLQLTTPYTVSLTASVSNAIWLKQDGGIEARNDLLRPTIPGIFLGFAICDGSGVTSIDTSGVVYGDNGRLYRETADLLLPGDTPASNIVLVTKTINGTFLWDGAKHLQHVDRDKQLITPFRKEVISGTRQITLADPNLLYFLSTAARTILLPDPSTITLGHTWVINNANPSGGFTMTVKDYTNTTTIATLTQGTAVPINPIVDNSGNVAFNTSITAVPVGTA